MGGLACCSPWGPKGSDTTGRLNTSNPNIATGLLPMMLKFLTCLSLFLSLTALGENYSYYVLKFTLALPQALVLINLKAKGLDTLAL